MSNVYHVTGGADSSAPIRAFIAIPTYDGKLTAPCASSLYAEIAALNAAGIAHELYIMSGNCHVDDARNGCVRDFLLTNCTHLFFVDADVGWETGAMARLLKTPHEIVAGVYPKKWDEPSYPVEVLPGVDLMADEWGCTEVEGAPTGFMCIKRSALEALVEVHKHRRYYGQNKADTEPYTIIFERTYEAGRRFSGDYAFCRKWRSGGGRIMVNPEIEFVHQGDKEWAGNLATYWRRTYGVSEARFNLAMERLKNGNPTPECFLWLWEHWDNKWSAPPSFLAACYHQAKKADGPILECGSGLTTLVLAAATENEIVTLEHDPAWAAKVNDTLAKQGISHSVKLAPIKDGWYSEIPKEKFTFCVVDGPPRNIGRTEIFKKLNGQISDAKVLFDDTDNQAYMAELTKWADAHGKSIKTFDRFSLAE